MLYEFLKWNRRLKEVLFKEVILMDFYEMLHNVTKIEKVCNIYNSIDKIIFSKIDI